MTKPTETQGALVHTELPWNTGDKINEYRDNSLWIVPVWANNAPSGDKIACHVLSESRGVAQANSRFICRAVNSHEALVEAVKMMTDKTHKHYGRLDIAKQVLTLAEKE